MANSVKIDHLLRYANNLPTSLEVVCRLMLMLRNPTQDNSEIVDVLLTDRDLALRLVGKLSNQDRKNLSDNNSALSNDFQAEIHQKVSEAVLQMGYRSLLRLISALSIGQLLSSECEGYGFPKRSLWYHSAACGLSCQLLCDILSDTDRPTYDSSLAFIAGITHDIGKVCFNKSIFEHRVEIGNLLGKGTKDWTQIEKSLLGGDHAEIGGILAKNWKLPKEIVSGIKYHHKPRESCFLSNVIHLSDYIARVVLPTSGWFNFRVKVKPEILENTQLNYQDFDTVVRHIKNEPHLLKLYTQL